MRKINIGFVVVAIMHIIFWIVFALLLFGCSTTKRATHHFNKAYYLSQNVVASGCSTLFPVESKTEYIEGEDVVTRDTVYVDCDSVLRAQDESQSGKGIHQNNGSNKPSSRTGPTVPMVIESHSRVDTSKITQRDSAGMAVLCNRIDSMKGIITKRDVRIESVTKTRNVLWWVSGALFIVLALVVYAIIKQINFKQVLK